MSGDPINIFQGKGGCHGLATISAGKTIGLLPHLLFKNIHLLINVPVIGFFKFCKEAAHFGPGVTNLLPEGSKIDGLYTTHAPEDTA